MLDTDVLDTGILAVLSQMQHWVERVIAYASKTLDRTRKKYCTVVFQPPFYQLTVVVSVCIIQNRIRPARRSLDEVIRASSCRVVTV